MSIKTYRLARASFFTSVLALTLPPAAAGGGNPPPPAAAAAAELELRLAADGDVYLVLDLQPGALEVRTRGTTLETLPLAGAGLYRFRSFRSAGEMIVPLPAVRTVVEDVEAAYRQVIAPERLEPFPADEDEISSGRPAPPPAPERPDAYRVALDDGFVLAVGRRLPASGLMSRLGQSLADGWQRLRGRSPERPDLIALALAPEDARQLHYLLRPGTLLLVTASSEPAVGAGERISE